MENATFDIAAVAGAGMRIAAVAGTGMHIAAVAGAGPTQIGRASCRERV